MAVIVRPIPGLALIIMGICSGVNPCPAQEVSHAPSQELLQYVQEARNKGFNENDIKEEAAAAGWTPEVVEQALASIRIRESAAGAKPAGTTRPLLAAGAREPEDGSKGDLSRGMPDYYRISPGDTLQISVWKEPDASVPVTIVRPDGRITVPMVKEIAVAGLTLSEAEAVITNRLKQFLTEPAVTVVAVNIAAKKVYAIGGVRREGPVPYTYGMTVLQALSEAGGLTDYARRKKIYILRPEDGKERRLPFNYDEVVKGEKMEQNVFLLPNDTIMVPH